MIRRVFYAAAGPGDIIAAHESWKRGTPHPTEVSLTYSGQIEQFCHELGAEAYLVSTHARTQLVKDGPFTLEHRPKPNPGAAGLAHHRRELAYGRGLVRTARAFGAEVAILDAGVTHYFAMEAFHRAGLRVAVVLHNTLWPEGNRPRAPVQRVLQLLNARFFRRTPAAVIGVSPVCTRQVEALCGGRTAPLLQMRAQFRREHFARIPAPPPWEERPFRVVFVGRVEHGKGVFDLLEMARLLEARAPGLVRFELCGTGSALEPLRAEARRLGLAEVVNVRGWTSPEDQIGVYARCHAAIVPTRSDFEEGLPMTAAEAVLCGRPVVTCAVVPALEILRGACLEARTDDPASYADQLHALATDRARYEALRAACAGQGAPFLDRAQGLTAVLHHAFGTAPAATREAADVA